MRLMAHHRRNLNYNVLTKQKTNQIGCLFVNLSTPKLSGEATRGGGGGHAAPGKFKIFSGIFCIMKNMHNPITMPIIRHYKAVA